MMLESEHLQPQDQGLWPQILTTQTAEALHPNPSPVPTNPPPPRPQGQAPSTPRDPAQPSRPSHSAGSWEGSSHGWDNVHSAPTGQHPPPTLTGPCLPGRIRSPRVASCPVREQTCPTQTHTFPSPDLTLLPSCLRELLTPDPGPCPRPLQPGDPASAPHCRASVSSRGPVSPDPLECKPREEQFGVRSLRGSGRTRAAWRAVFGGSPKTPHGDPDATEGHQPLGPCHPVGDPPLAIPYSRSLPKYSGTVTQ